MSRSISLTTFQLIVFFIGLILYIHGLAAETPRGTMPRFISSKPFRNNTKICRDGVPGICDTFNMTDVKYMCGPLIQSINMHEEYAWTSISEHKCKDTVCHIEVETNGSYYHGSIDCSNNSSWAITCCCTTFSNNDKH